MITDIRPYQKHLDEFDLTEQQKLELVNAIWVISKHLLDRKFGIHPWDKRSVGQKFQETMQELNPKSPPRSRTTKARKFKASKRLYQGEKTKNIGESKP